MRNSIVLAILAACGGSSPIHPQSPGSRGPRASDHLARAQQEDEQARDRAMWPDTHRADATGRVDQALVGTPWHATWDTAADHERAAAHHRSAADALHAEFVLACGERSFGDISASPIVRYGMGGNTTQLGVTLYLSPQAGPADRLLADLRCHRAWMMLQPANMDTCPLDLVGLLVDVKGEDEGFTLTLSVRDPALVPELQRRVARELELGHR